MNRENTEVILLVKRTLYFSGRLHCHTLLSLFFNFFSIDIIIVAFSLFFLKKQIHKLIILINY